MIELLIICFIAGAAGALLQGMVGVGTGIVIVPLLTFILPRYGISSAMAIHVALATSMAAIAINAFSAVLIHHKYQNVKWDIFKKTVIPSTLGACLGALTASYLPARWLEIIFGIFLVLVAAYMVFKKIPHDEKQVAADLSLPKMISGGAGVGFVASIIGSGGGILMVPFLHSLKIKMRYAVGTSTVVGLPVAVCGAVTYVVAGLVQAPPSLDTIGYLHWPALLAISAAGMFFAPLGIRLATVMPTVVLQRIFAVCIMIIGIKMLIAI